MIPQKISVLSTAFLFPARIFPVDCALFRCSVTDAIFPSCVMANISTQYETSCESC